MGLLVVAGGCVYAGSSLVSRVRDGGWADFIERSADAVLYERGR